MKDMALGKSPVRTLLVRSKNPRHNKSTSPFRNLSALKGPRNVASGHARRVPDPPPGPNPERVAGLPPPGCDPFRVGRFPGLLTPGRCPRLGYASPAGMSGSNQCFEEALGLRLSLASCSLLWSSACLCASVAQASVGVYKQSRNVLSFHEMMLGDTPSIKDLLHCGARKAPKRGPCRGRFRTVGHVDCEYARRRLDAEPS
jgi:hypothetical protein